MNGKPVLVYQPRLYKALHQAGAAVEPYVSATLLFNGCYLAGQVIADKGRTVIVALLAREYEFALAMHRLPECLFGGRRLRIGLEIAPGVVTDPAIEYGIYAIEETVEVHILIHNTPVDLSCGSFNKTVERYR